MTVVYVLNKDGEPLMPTTRCGHVRHLLNTKQARVVRLRPFTIKLKYETLNIIQELAGGTDLGRTNIGNAVLDENSESVYIDKIQTRNKDIPKLMEERRSHRQASRRGERLCRKRLAKKHNTCSKKLKNGRLVAGTQKPTEVKDIINTEARFSNRKKRRLITPTVNQLVETTLNGIDNIRKILPIKKWTIEANRFAFMQMEDGSVQGIDFQNGKLKGYDSVDEFVFDRQEGKCFCCGNPIKHFHHVIPRSQGGSDGADNKVGLCEKCHSLYHKRELEINAQGFYKKYAALSVLNQAVPYIYKGLVERLGEENVFICSRFDTKNIRIAADLEKDHDIDAICIASMSTDSLPKKPEIETFLIKQFRRHDRAIIKSQRERTYKAGSDTIAKNRTPRYEQQGFALSQWRDEMLKTFSEKEVRQMISQLKVIPSRRYYNNTDRIMPGALVIYMPKGKPKIPVGQIFILTSQLSNGQYYQYKGKNIPSKDCLILKQNTGLVYIQGDSSRHLKC